MRCSFTNHSANERTFLAWVRTALAIVGFGILVAKLDDQGNLSGGIGWTGMALLFLGLVVILSAAVRFFLTRKHLNQGELEAAAPVVLDVLLIIALVALFATLIGFAAHVMVKG